MPGQHARGIIISGWVFLIRDQVNGMATILNVGFAISESDIVSKAESAAGDAEIERQT